MELSIKSTEFLDSFDHINSKVLDEYGKNKLDLFVLKINANEFDYNSLSDRLTDPVIEYSLSRKVRERYSDRPGTLSRKAREKFLDYLKNKGELGELLLYCFLETHLNAPKILSKLELKTSTGHYVNGADGVHFLKLDDGNYQLIFGESKTIKSLTTALTDAFKSIDEFKRCINAKGDEKSGLPYEKALVSDNLEKEEYNDEEADFIRSIIYPRRDNDFEVDDAFGIFVGYEISISVADKCLPNSEFRLKIQDQVKSEVEKSFEHIKKKIENYKLSGHQFYIYVLPFTNLEDSRKKIQKEITA
ncbi:HamA C-terminal domain-containing protein [Gynuella sp.]|uniref:HamA C-terminal domain-containing protein n=1 Tax=Gynuella sp. TaxID=2969146 RepID=UPI003D0A2CA1